MALPAAERGRLRLRDGGGEGWGIRKAFIATLCRLAETDPRVLLLTGDLGFSVIEPFAERWPERFFNVGVAEQNMVGMATGMAEGGYLPYVYSIGTFASLRPYEFIRNGPVANRLPVRIVGVGGGVEYGSNGLTHFALEDIGVMRMQPGLTVIAPADHQQAAAAVRATYDIDGPIYYRLGKDDNRLVPGLEGRFDLSRIQWLSEGSDLLILSLGSISAAVAEVAKALSDRGVSVSAGVVAVANPAPRKDLVDALRRHSKVMTVEAHYREGGLGSLVAEVIADEGLGSRLVRCAVEEIPFGITGSEAFMNQVIGLSTDALEERALALLDGDLPAR